MKISSLPALLGCLTALLLPLHAATDAEVKARETALQLAGAFSNDGFKLRDGTWQGTLEAGKPLVLEVNLYVGNQYWFSLGTGGDAKKVTLSVHSESGETLAAEPYEDANQQAAGFAPRVSGPYYIRLEASEGAMAPFCLVYSYK